MIYKPYLYLFIILLLSCSEDNNNVIDDISEQSNVFLAPATIQYKDVSSVDPNLLSLDVYSYNNTEQKRPVIIWIHGGGWRIGDKVNQLQNKLTYFENLGYVFISINYRLSPNPPELDNPNRLQFPTHIEDVAAAIHWIENNISDFGGDIDNLMVMGHSAGAHLAALIATNPIYLSAFNISTNIFKGVASFDTQGYDIPSLLEFTTNTDTQTTYENAFGNDSSIWEDASPTLNVDNNPNLPNQFFLVQRGVPLRRTLQQNFANTLESNNVNVTFIDASPLTHNEVNIAIGDENDTIITPRLTAFLKSIFD